MKLTNEMRNLFVKQVIADVPTTDYESQIRDVALKTVLKHMPPAVRKVWDDEATRHWLHMWHRRVGGVYLATPMTDDGLTFEKIEGEVDAAAAPLEQAMDEQSDHINELRRNLSAAVAKITTVEALRKQFPEFEKYLPALSAPTPNLPAPQIVSDLVKAGWPKGAQK